MGYLQFQRNAGDGILALTSVQAKVVALSDHNVSF